MDHQEFELKESWQAKHWACFVGVNHYQDEVISHLHYCVNGARAFHDRLTTHSEDNYRSDQVRLLLNEDRHQAAATRFNILTALTELTKCTGRKDLLLFYFAGYGQLIGDEAILLPADVSHKLLLDTSISLKRVKEIVYQAEARTKVIILDTYRAGVKLAGQAPEQEGEKFIQNVFEETEGMAVLVSSMEYEFSREDREKGYGLFTSYLLEGIARAAKSNPDRFITLHEIANHVAQKLKRWAELHHTAQPPLFDFTGMGEVALLPPANKVVKSFPQATITVEPIEHPDPVGGKFPTAVREARDFYNRRLELKRIKDILKATTDKPIIIQGERGIGKTSLLNRIVRLLTEAWDSPHRFLYCAIEPNSIASCADFAREMWYGLQQCLHQNRSAPAQALDTSFHFDTFSRFVVQISRLQLQQPEATFVFFLDEFDKIVYQCDDLEQKRILGLMRYMVEATDLPFIFVISILQDLPTFYGSPFPADKIILHPFERADMEEMVKSLLKGHATITEPALSWLDRYTGRHPYFVKLLLAKLFEAYALRQEKEEVTVEMLQTALGLARPSTWTDDIFSNIYQTYLNDDERYILLWLASSADGALTAREVVEAGAQLGSVFEGLVRRAYLISQAEGGYRLRIGLQHDWLRHWAKFEAELERLQVPGHIFLPPPQEKLFLSAATQPAEVGLFLDLSSQRVYLEGQEVKNNLTDMEYRALIYLAERSGQVVAKDEFANYVWGEPYYEGDDQRISQLIHRLRNFLGDKKRPYNYLETLRKRGFRLQHARLASTSNSRG